MFYVSCTCIGISPPDSGKFLYVLLKILFIGIEFFFFFYGHNLSVWTFHSVPKLSPVLLYFYNYYFSEIPLVLALEASWEFGSFRDQSGITIVVTQQSSLQCQEASLGVWGRGGRSVRTACLPSLLDFRLIK